MIYRVRHVTEYIYAVPVSTSHHELHLLPREVPGQTVRSELLYSVPAPAVRRDRFDWFGNRATHLAIHERHTRLAVTSDLEIEVHHEPAPEDESSWEEARDAVNAEAEPVARAAIEFVLPSPRVTLSPSALDFARESFPAGRPLAEAARELMHRIFTDFTYDPVATDVSTSVDEAMRQRRGVCQDFAHIQIACLRGLGVPARYVSGYLVTRSSGEPGLVGSDASHAWLSVRLASGAWLDLDPTNDVVPSDRHIAIAHGRDFGDVTPMRGVILGGGRHELRVGVDVRRVDGRKVQPQDQNQNQDQDQDEDQSQSQSQSQG